MDVDEDLSASTYTFDSSPTGLAASTINDSGAFTPRGVDHTTLVPPSALSVLLAHKQESKGSRELLGDEHVSSEIGRQSTSTPAYPTSQTSITPTNERQGSAYFASVAVDAQRRLESVLGPRPHFAASAEEVHAELPDRSQQVPDETTSLLYADRVTSLHEDANNGPMFAVTKTQPQHAKPITPTSYGSIAFLHTPSETFRRVLDPNTGRKVFKAIPAVVLGTLLNILDGISCTYFYLQLLHIDPAFAVA